MSDYAPPTNGGGNNKFAVIGVLLLLGGGGGIYAITRPPAPAPTPPAPHVEPAHDAGPPVVPTVTPPIELPPDEPDAGPPPDVQQAAPHIRYVTRYVGGCTGSIDINRVNATAQANYGGLRACYEHELRANPGLRGPLAARMMINTSGHADDVGVTTPMNSRALVACVKRTLQRVSFPPSRGGCAVAEVRFNFSPRE